MDDPTGMRKSRYTVLMRAAQTKRASYLQLHLEPSLHQTRPSLSPPLKPTTQRGNAATTDIPVAAAAPHAVCRPALRRPRIKLTTLRSKRLREAPSSLNLSTLETSAGARSDVSIPPLLFERCATRAAWHISRALSLQRFNRFRGYPCRGEHPQQTARRAQVAPLEPHDARARERKPRLALALLHNVSITVAPERSRSSSYFASPSNSPNTVRPSVISNTKSAQ